MIQASGSPVRRRPTSASRSSVVVAGPGQELVRLLLGGDEPAVERVETSAREAVHAVQTGRPRRER